MEKLDELSEIKPEPLPTEDINKVDVRLFQGEFIVEVPANMDGEKGRESIRDEFIKWYRNHAEVKVLERVEKYKDMLGVEPNNVKIKKTKETVG